jgi:uncharacterized protein
MAELIYPPPAQSGDLPQVHFFDSADGVHMLVVDGSRIYAVDEQTRRDLNQGPGIRERLIDLGCVEHFPSIGDNPPATPPVRALSLAVAQTCNLGCSYCYADGGDFGGVKQNMPWPVAKASIDQLIDSARGDADSIMLAFLGGEPLINRKLIHQAVEYAVAQAGGAGLGARFSITTNGTLLRPEDFAFFERYRFAVTVSMDGDREDHDRLRGYKRGGGTFDDIVARLGRHFSAPGREGASTYSARVSVTPRNLRLTEYIDTLSDIGFMEVGFAPVIHAPVAGSELTQTQFQQYLEALQQCGDVFKQKVLAGEAYGFSNMHAAMAEIHKGTHRPYPCGAGAGYLGLSADGQYYACHRFVNDEAGSLGDIDGGISDRGRAQWLAAHHVHRQSPCTSCWAMYLCGGGCYHEVAGKGRLSCDLIRGWLSYCLGAYVELSKQRPEYFDALAEIT